jgi:hypothetical protein
VLKDPQTDFTFTFYFSLYYKAIIRHYEILQDSWFSPVQWLYHNTQLRSQPYQQVYNMEAEKGTILFTSCIVKESYKGIKVSYYPAHKMHFFPKIVTEIRPASYAPKVSIISKLINTRTRIKWKQPWKWF